IEPLLELVRDPTLHWYCRSVASNILLDVTRDNAEQRARLLATLRELLAGYVARAQARARDFGAEDYMIAGSLVVDLAHVADPEARPLIEAALEADISEMMNRRNVEDAYRQGEQPFRPQIPWLDVYREHLQRHRDYERRKAEPPPPPVLPS